MKTCTWDCKRLGLEHMHGTHESVFLCNRLEVPEAYAEDNSALADVLEDAWDLLPGAEWLTRTVRVSWGDACTIKETTGRLF